MPHLPFISMINENFGLQLHIMLNACVSSSVSSANTRHGIECWLTLFVSPHVLQPLILFFLSSCFSELFTFPGPTAPCLTSLRVVCDTKARWWSMRQHTLLSIWNIRRRRNWRQQYLFCSCFAAHPNQRWGSLQSGPWIRSVFWIILLYLFIYLNFLCAVVNFLLILKVRKFRRHFDLRFGTNTVYHRWPWSILLLLPPVTLTWRT